MIHTHTFQRLQLTLLVWMAIVAPASICAQDDFYAKYRQAWLEKAETHKPQLQQTKKRPVEFVDIIKDQNAYQGWRAVGKSGIENLSKRSLKAEKSFIVDFGEHLTGYFSFFLSQLDRTPDAPVRIKFTFGEIPSEVMTPFDPYPGSLSRAWLQDETVTVMTIPSTVTISRRLSFRYVKVELIAAPNYHFSISDMECVALSSVSLTPPPLQQSASDIIRKIDAVGLTTLKECMQTVYEDGPKRDQRLWIGDLYLEAMANNYSFKQHQLTQRCLYLLAGLSDESGFLNSAVFEYPTPRPQAKQFLLEYALLFNVALKDYLEATHDTETALDLWPVAKKQIDIIHTYLQTNGLMNYDKANSEWWIFFDWKENLHKEVALQGVSIFALQQTYELAKLLHKEKEVTSYPALIKKMSAAAHTHYYNASSGLFAGITNKQISYASQIWMILSGVPSKAEAQKALKASLVTPEIYFPGTPYLYHYYIQALINSDMKTEAKASLIDYWGGMIAKGADTFWEAYDPKNDFISPYNFYPINSYCHAWSCTPVYFIRKYPEVFQ